MARALLVLVLAIAAMLPGTTSALAHKLKIFATAIGAEVQGRAYFVGGGPALGVPVTLRDSAGAIAAAATTRPPDGTFVMTLPFRDDFTLIADAQDGHVADFRLLAGRLAETLPTAPHALPATAATAPAVAIAEGPADADAQGIEAAVARQVAPLADQIDALQASIGLRDIIGGVGYVLGIFGLWALLARRRGQAR